jgi:hypothetical protein
MDKNKKITHYVGIPSCYLNLANKGLGFWDIMAW